MVFKLIVRMKIIVILTENKYYDNFAKALKTGNYDRIKIWHVNCNTIDCRQKKNKILCKKE